tara:strand:+ start:1414 stop:1635 length:222 start_codon:yes stop_codon:yes gene_type:complete
MKDYKNQKPEIQSSYNFKTGELEYKGYFKISKEEIIKYYDGSVISFIEERTEELSEHIESSLLDNHFLEYKND